MGIKEDIEILCQIVTRELEVDVKGRSLVEECRRVEDWLNSPSCPLVDEEELEE